ncbi:MAG: RICIN domain-containing protein [Treponema sp.]|nr:RICIN domain-containing protein [Treponema sp.]
MKKITVFVFMFALIAGGVFANPFLGQWNNMAMNANWGREVLSTITFTPTQWTLSNEGGDGMISNPPGTFRIFGNTATLTDSRGQNAGTATVSGNTLTLNRAGSTVVYTRSEITVPGTDLAAKLHWIQQNAISSITYNIELTRNEHLHNHLLHYPGKSVTVQFSARGGNRYIGVAGDSGRVLIVGEGVYLVLGNNVSLFGTETGTENSRVVTVNKGGSLTMKAGSKISGSADGGVFVNGGSFRMEGGEISGNAARDGAGVLVEAGGFFGMFGGEITGNRAAANGGGVAVRGDFSKISFSGGVIHGNRAGTDGGGVFLAGEDFQMSENAMIHGNIAGRNGGGVGISSGIFQKSGGIITGVDSPASSNMGGGAVVGGAFIRNNASGPNDKLNTHVAGSAGGWETATASINQPHVSIDLPRIPRGDATPPAQTDYSGTWRIVAKNGMYIHVEGGANATNNGRVFQTWTGTGGTNAQFRFQRQSDGTYIITAVHSGRAMDIQHHKTENGVKVHQWALNNTARNQRWHIVDAGGGFISFRNDLTGMFLDVPGNKTGNGHKLQQWTGNGTPNQQFKLVKVN